MHFGSPLEEVNALNSFARRVKKPDADAFDLEGLRSNCCPECGATQTTIRSDGRLRVFPEGPAGYNWLATVAFDYAAARQHIRHDLNGLLVPYEDTEAFIAQSKAIISDMARVQRLRNAARHTMESQTWERIMGDLESVLNDTIRVQGVRNGQPELSAATD